MVGVDRITCQPITDGDVDSILHTTIAANGDRGGGVDIQPRTRIAGSGMSVYDLIGDSIAIMYPRVSGRQTVPRSELWALLQYVVEVNPNRFWPAFGHAPSTTCWQQRRQLVENLFNS